MKLPNSITCYIPYRITVLYFIQALDETRRQSTHLRGDLLVRFFKHLFRGGFEISQKLLGHLVLSVNRCQADVETAWELQGVQVPAQFSHPRVDFKNVDAVDTNEAIISINQSLTQSIGSCVPTARS